MALVGARGRLGSVASPCGVLSWIPIVVFAVASTIAVPHTLRVTAGASLGWGSGVEVVRSFAAMTAVRIGTLVDPWAAVTRHFRRPETEQQPRLLHGSGTVLTGSSGGVGA